MIVNTVTVVLCIKGLMILLTMVSGCARAGGTAKAAAGRLR